MRAPNGRGLGRLEVRRSEHSRIMMCHHRAFAQPSRIRRLVGANPGGRCPAAPIDEPKN
jgi:hypothetical protein